MHELQETLDQNPPKKRTKLLPSPPHDDEVIHHLTLINAAASPDKLQPRTVVWIADSFCEGATHVANMLSRNTHHSLNVNFSDLISQSHHKTQNF